MQRGKPQKIQKVGNSKGVIICKDILTIMGITKIGDDVLVDYDGENVIIRKAEKNIKKEVV
jgi:antitoxin component of MazEF toxin-antitoxin module